MRAWQGLARAGEALPRAGEGLARAGQGLARACEELARVGKLRMQLSHYSGPKNVLVDLDAIL